MGPDLGFDLGLARAPTLVIAGVLGLIIGSFLTVVIHRVPRGESVVWPRSRCPACHAAISPARNIPLISWFILRGRCAHCHEGISVRYPLVEAATAGLFVAVTARVGPTAALPAFLYLAAIVVALAAIDWEVRRLPDDIVWPSYPIAASALTIAALTSGQTLPILRALAAMGALFTLYLLLAVARPGGMGYGDVKLAGLIGLYLGWLGWDAVIVGTLAGFLFGAIAGIALIVRGRARPATAIAFGPYMLAGAMVALFATGPLATWYLSLITPTI